MNITIDKTGTGFIVHAEGSTIEIEQVAAHALAIFELLSERERAYLKSQRSKRAKEAAEYRRQAWARKRG